MMLYELNQIKQIRQKLGLTQSQLAKLADVSQSLITKVERGQIEPSYPIAKKIFETLDDQLHSKQHITLAKDVCSTKIISIKSDATIDNAIKKMEKNAISQLPVENENIYVGSMTEITIVRNFEKIKDKNVKIEEIMDDPFPMMPDKTPLNLIVDVLKTYPAVIITRNGKGKCIITEADLVKNL